MLPSPLAVSPTFFALIGATPLALLLLCLLLVWVRLLSPHERLSAGGLLLIGGFVLFPSLHHAASIRTMPDSLEYAVGAYRMFHDGVYAITLNGIDLPPRYPIGFSLFVLVPGLLINSSSALGSGVLAVWIVTTLGFPCVYLLGRRLYSEVAGIIAVAIYLLIPGLWTASQEVLSNAPAAGASLATALLLYLLGTSISQRSVRIVVAGGAGCGILLLIACRPLSVLLLLPVTLWCRSRKASFAEILGILLPPIALCLATAAYNQHVFGDLFRTGYHFYSAIPYDHNSLTFGVQYFMGNLRQLWSSGLIVLFLLAIAASRFVTFDASAKMLRFTCLFFAACTAGFHAFYFYPWTFFFLPAVALLVPFVAVVVAHALRIVMARNAQKGAWIILILTALALRAAIVSASQSYNPRAAYLSSVTSSLPHGAIFVTGLPAPFVQLYGAGRSDLQVLPISRRVEYASKVLMPRRAPEIDTTTLTALDTRAPVLLQHGAQEIYSGVGVESCNTLEQAIREGREVFLDTRFTTEQERQACDATLFRQVVIDGLEKVAVLAQ
jgi:hypothetical protein